MEASREKLVDKGEKLFILVRKDLGLDYGAVQAGHAVAEWVKSATISETYRIHRRWGLGSISRDITLGKWNNTLVYLHVPDIHRLEDWARKLDRKGIPYVGFVEPDLNDEPTAFAVLGHDELFKNLQAFS